MKNIIAGFIVWVFGGFIVLFTLFAIVYEGFIKGYLINGDFAGAIPLIAILIGLILYWACNNYEKLK